MIGVYIRPSEMTKEQYHQIDEQVQASGVELKGLLVHTCFGEGEGLAIFDVWESQEDFEAFGATLGPIVAASGLPPMEPMIVPMIDFQVG